MSKALRKQGAEVLSEKKCPLPVNGLLNGPRVHKNIYCPGDPISRKCFRPLYRKDLIQVRSVTLQKVLKAESIDIAGKLL